MPTSVHEFAWPDRVVVGTIGVPGSRTFYLQVRAGKQIVSIALEKQQSAQLAEKIDEILDQLITVQGNPFSVPTSTPIELVDNDPLEAVDEQFRAGAMSLGWDPTTAQVVIEAYPMVEVDVDDNDEPLVEDGAIEAEMLLVRMPVGTARAFAKRTREIVGAGRPTCPLCGYPMDADGHSCTLPEA
ncbi:putative repeat protein (TIGR03847 family) [Arthrobacter bambusae]|uniref:Repeat protein (TIGR03847 family) n=1 Tax=Arthrobacter bambusae TaxID=1338426 RepID=A0ABV2P1V9_9MICC